ncbi:hypothetical protein RFI_05848 [Reticulomyxa filosa]|uniref:Uncharacterized protein n=1 Tax=Reticulomyxa filosa TaxID=46433 RepID=X6NZG6_RETFI|nr:hypothetical protein RFI_05848 [Reticulomyxa filosa]|eukprot:ETO31273.1 hypothetical protein RFI_05848 [Reticulomyxa filosa]
MNLVEDEVEVGFGFGFVVGAEFIVDGFVINEFEFEIAFAFETDELAVAIGVEFIFIFVFAFVFIFEVEFVTTEFTVGRFAVDETETDEFELVVDDGTGAFVVT